MLTIIEEPNAFYHLSNIQIRFLHHSGMQENFKELHKDLDTLKSSGFSVSEIKKDISAMEEEKEQILRRIDRLKKKAEGIPGTTNLMSITQSLRRETEKEEKISKQKQEQKTVGFYSIFNLPQYKSIFLSKLFLLRKDLVYKDMRLKFCQNLIES